MVTGKEDVANRLPCAKSFISLDACSGYWQLPVDDKGAKLLTFNNHGIDIYWNVPKKTVENSSKGILWML